MRTLYRVLLLGPVEPTRVRTRCDRHPLRARLLPLLMLLQEEEEEEVGLRPEVMPRPVCRHSTCSCITSRPSWE